MPSPDPLQLLSESLPSLANSPLDWQDLPLLRYALEVGAIELAIRNGKPEQLQQLGEIEHGSEQVFRAKQDEDRATELDLQSHALILKMTGSRLITGMQQVLVHFCRLAPRSELKVAAEGIIWEHRELYQAIRDCDVERARSMIRLQFRRLFNDGQYPGHPRQPSNDCSTWSYCCRYAILPRCPFPQAVSRRASPSFRWQSLDPATGTVPALCRGPRYSPYFGRSPT